MAQPIEREPRGGAEYETKVAALAKRDPSAFATLELVEESILSDQARTHRRRSMPDGTTFDLTAYDEWNVMLSFRTSESGRIEFIDYRFFER
jgi:hypothetical protein